jgi:ParB-like chromosome segregation protein Spo0J
MERNGVDTAQFPLIVMKHPDAALAAEGWYMVICGNHRLLAMRAMKYEQGVHCIIVAPKSDEERMAIAIGKRLVVIRAFISVEF